MGLREKLVEMRDSVETRDSGIADPYIDPFQLVAIVELEGRTMGFL